MLKKISGSACFLMAVVFIAGCSTREKKMDIVETAIAAGNFKT